MPPRIGPTPEDSSSGRALAGRVWRIVAVALTLAVVLTVELILLRDRISRDVGTLGQAGRAAVRPTANAPPTIPPRPVTRILPPAAGPVSGVDVRALGACVPGANCQVRVLVRLRPQPVAGVLDWRFQILDRCTGAVTETVGGRLPVAAGGDGAAVVDTVALPTGRAFAVTAVTGLPAIAASSPLLVPVRAGC